MGAERNMWSPEEDVVLRAQYIERGAVECSRVLGRRIGSVYHRAKLIGLTRVRRWTNSEDKILRNEWGDKPIKWIARKLGRTHSAVYWRAGQMGLSLGCPDGYEYLTAAAERTGYATAQLRVILGWAGVGIQRCFSREADKSKIRPTHFVCAFDVDEAIEQWHRTEVLTTAAKARDLYEGTLRRWLLEAKATGVQVPPEPEKRKCRWRIPTEIIDRVVAERAKLETMRTAAARNGVRPDTLSQWLRQAGVPRGPGRLWLVSREQVELAITKALAKTNNRAGHVRARRAA